MEILEEPKPSFAEREIEDEIRNAKAYLLRSSATNGENLYDHLVTAITKILEEKPLDVIDNFEDISRETKRARFKQDPDTIQDQAEIPAEVDLANEHRCLFERKDAEIPDKIDEEVEEEGSQVLGDILEHTYYFEQANVGIGREESFRVFLALKQLSDAYLFESCRFWGKIFGVHRNYFIAEAQFKEGQDPVVEEEEDESRSQQEAEEAKESILLGGDEEQQSEFDDMPKPDYKPPIPVPKEDAGTGCNSKVYFVCNEPGKSWHRLPPVTPQQIAISRQIRKLMTGDLDAEVISYPPFPGNEANYLRAQLARISAATHISPQGYYIFEENEDDDEEGIGPDHFEVNMEFEGLPVGELTDPSMSFWVHHVPYILPQGRCTWFDVSQPSEEDEEDEDEDEEREEPDEVEPEGGPPLLTPLSEDNEVDGIPAWTPQKSTTLIPQYAIAILHSNLWPGATAYSVERKFENIYVGWGLKYSAENYSPPVPPATQEEYPSGPEVTEAEDPTVEQERALQAAQQEALEQEEEDDDDDVDSQGSFDEKTSLVRSGQLSFSYTQSITKYQSTHEQDPRSADTSGAEADKIDDGQLSSIMTDFQASFFLPSLLISSYSTVRQSYDKMARSMAQSMAKRSIYTSRSFAYSIIEKLSDDRGASFGLTMFNILPALLGSALFTIPYAISIGGYSTIPVFILIAIFADFTCLLLADCMYDVSPRSRRLKRTKLDYVEIAEAAFGRHSARLINFTLVFYLFASNIVLLVLIGKSFYSILSRYTDLSLNAVMAIFSILVLPTLFIQRLSHLAYLSLVSTLAVVVGTIATMAIFVVKNKSWKTNSDVVPDFNWEGFALALGMWSYTIVPHTIIPQVEACMRQPEKFRKAVHLSFGISTPIKIIFSVMGALTYGSSTQALVTKNVVVSSYPVSVLANAVICVYAVCNFPLTFFVVCDAFDSITLGTKHINLKKGGKFHPLWILLTRPVLVSIGLGIGMVVPYFGLLVGILGSLLGTLLVFVFPCVFHLKLKWKKQSMLWNVLEIVVLFIGSAVGVIGLYASVKGLYLAISGKNSA